MNVFLYIVTIITFLAMYAEKDKGSKHTLCFCFIASLFLLVAFNVLKGVF